MCKSVFALELGENMIDRQADIDINLMRCVALMRSLFVLHKGMWRDHQKAVF